MQKIPRWDPLGYPKLASPDAFDWIIEGTPIEEVISTRRNADGETFFTETEKSHGGTFLSEVF